MFHRDTSVQHGRCKNNSAYRNGSMVESGRCRKAKAADVKAADVAESGRCWAKAADVRVKVADVRTKAADV